MQLKIGITLTLWISILVQSNRLNGQGKILWKFETDGRVYTSALISEEVVYFGSGDGNFYAVNNHGEKLWEFKTGGPVHSSAAIFQNMICFGSGDGKLYALDKNSGTLAWSFSSKGEKSYGLWDYYLSSPRVSDGVIYWGSGDGHLYAINGVSGNLRWKFKTDGIVHASPVTDDDKVYFGGFDGYFYALDKSNGALIWKFNSIGDTYFPKGEIQKSALLDDGMLYFGSRDYNIYALDAEDGTGNWNMKETAGWIIATPIMQNDKVYFGTSDGHVFYAMDKKSGKIVWKTPLAMRVFGSAVERENVIYFGTFDGKLLGLDCNTGEPKWEFQTENSRKNYSSIYDSEGHFRKDFELYGNDYEASEAKIHQLGSILSTPVIHKNVIYFGSSDGSFYAVEL